MSVGVSWYRLFLQMECTYQEEESDEISMALSSDAEAKVTLIDCMYIYIYIYIYIYYVAMVTAGLYIAYTPHQYST